MAKLSDDLISWRLSLNAGGVQGELNNISSAIRTLEKDNIALSKSIKDAEKQMRESEKQMDKLSRAGKENTKAFKDAEKMHREAAEDIRELNKRIAENNHSIETNKKQYKSLEGSLKLNEMTMYQLKKRAAELKEQMEHTSESANPKEYRRLGKDLGDVEKQMVVLGNKNKTLLQQFAGMNHPVGTAAKSVTGFGQALKALAANPIGAIILAIVVVFTAFFKVLKTSEKATHKLNQILAPLKVIFDAILNILQKLVIVLLDFVKAALGGFMKLLSMLPGVGDAFAKINEKAQEGIELEKAKQKLDINARKLLVSNAEKEREIARLRNEAKKKDKLSDAERLAALDEALRLEGEITAAKVAQAKEALKVAQAEADRTDNSKEVNDMLAQKQADLISAETEHYNNTRRLESERSNLVLEMQRETAEKAKKIREDLIKDNELALQREINLLKKQKAEGLITEEEFSAKEIQLTIESVQEKLKIKGLEKDKIAELESQLTDLMLKEAEKRLKVLNDTKIDVAIETNSYNERLKVLGLYGIESNKMTEAQLRDKLDLETEFQEKLTAIALKSEEERYKASLIETGVNTEDPSTLEGEKLKVYERLKAEHEANVSKIQDDANKSRLDSKKKFDDDLLKSNQKANTAALSAIDAAEQAKILQLKESLSEKLSTQNLSNEEMLRAQDEYNRKVREVEARSHADRLAVQEAYVQQLRSIENPSEEQKKALEAAEAAVRATQAKIYENKISDEKSYQDRRKAVLQQYRLETAVMQYNAEMEALRKQHEDGLLSVKEYEQAKLQLKLKYAQDYVNQAGQFVQSGADFVKSIEESATAGIQAEYAERSAALQQQFESGIISQEQYNSEKERLDYEQRASELEVQKKYADANFAMQVAQIGIATATGIMNAWASAATAGPAAPVLAGIMTALLVATAAAQIATANAERKRVKALTLGSPSGGGSKSAQPQTGSVVIKDAPGGFADGGYTGAGGKYEVAGFLPDGRPYHRGEYFVAQEEMKNSEVIPLVRAIENIRRRRTDKNPLPAGFADGGYTQQNSKTENYVMIDKLIVRFERAVDKFEKTKLPVEINYWEWKEVEEKMNKTNNLTKK